MNFPRSGPRFRSHIRQPQTTTARDCGAGDQYPIAAVSAYTSNDELELLCKNRDGEDSSEEDCKEYLSTSAKPKKRVRWSIITVHEFGVGLGGSAISTNGGPSIGLADTPEFTWTTNVGEMAECAEGVHRFTPNQRIRLLQAAGVPDGIISRHARETNIILGSRRRSKSSYDGSDLDEAEKEERNERPKEVTRKRSVDQAILDRPYSVYLRRPSMIPANHA
ncbi:hypothetical protein PsorP6_006302 [Peronosclerospora sorghi]|uniref:Uncharacterized protein n=1 Tax=Peronosclerospora sorghi TaxID=230839 RepID=A0ACC0W2I4_9STRA|nr:hypothetical protein PsorP6_006302 [Peronosclerospora sorghi]